MKKWILYVLFFIVGWVGILKKYIFKRFFFKSFEYVKWNCFKFSGVCKRFVLIYCLCDILRMFVFFRCIIKLLYGVWFNFDFNLDFFVECIVFIKCCFVKKKIYKLI